MQAITVHSADGTALAARIFEPAGRPQGNVVVGPAMGVPQEYYAAFAEWLAQQGWRVTTFDYRGSGAGAPPSLRGFRASLDDWTRDYEAVIDHAHAALPDAPLYLVGHSLGAQLPGLLSNQHKVHGLLSVAAGSGYWRENAPRLRRVVLLIWWVVVPLALRLCGYFPGRRLGIIGDLPEGVMRQWRRWCLDPRYSVGAEGERARQSYARVRFPVLALSVEDDEMMTLEGTHSLLSLYENAPRDLLRIAPAQFALPRIGHLGAFRREYQDKLWPHLADWLRRLPAQAPA